MDVTLIGPALSAMGEMCCEANRIINGRDSNVRVMLKADIKANCLTVELHIIQTVWEGAKSILNDGNVATAKDILEWLGIIRAGGSLAVGVGWGLISFLHWKKNRKEESASIQRTAGGDMVHIKIEGDNNIVVVPRPVYVLSKNAKVVESVKTIVSPVLTELGITNATFNHNGHDQLTIDKTLATALESIRVDADENVPQYFTARITVHSVTLDSKSRHWKFKLMGKVQDIDIGQTFIASDAINRGGVSVGDTYNVKLQMIERKTRNGEYKQDFKVMEVIEFIPGVRSVQTWISFNKGESGTGAKPE